MFRNCLEFLDTLFRDVDNRVNKHLRIKRRYRIEPAEWGYHLGDKRSCQFKVESGENKDIFL